MTSGSLFMSWRQSCYINYHASHEKSTQRTDNKRSSMETIIFALQTTPINSKITESLIINLTQNPWKTTWGAYSRGRPPPPLKFGPPPPLWISVTLRGGGGGMDIIFLELHNAYLAGYRIEGGGGTFLGSEASTRVAKLWGIFEYTLARQSALITSLFTQLCRLKIWTNLTLKTKLCVCRCWVMDNWEI